MSYYRDLREYLRTLEQRGKLVSIKSQVNKDTELMPLVRLQYRGLPEEERQAFVFDNMVDSRGRRYHTPVVVSALAGSSEIYGIGMMCPPEDIVEKLAKAQLHPVKPRVVDEGPVQTEVHAGDTLLQHGGLDEFPIPISTPGYDVAPFFTAPCWVTKDPETGIRNVGTYRAQLKSPTTTGIDFMVKTRGGFIHWKKCKQRGIPLPAAIVVGGPPSIGYVSTASLPVDSDEFAFAGGIAREPLELVKCKTVDLEVPAQAEIVVEGEINTSEVEPEGPFGEAIGHISMTQPRPYFTVRCITHRPNPIWLAMISQYPPSESSKIRQLSNESLVFKHLRYDLGMEHVLAVACHEAVGSNRLWVVQVRKTGQDEVWRTLEAVGNKHKLSKVIIAVDEDVDPQALEAVMWAVCHRVQPHRDTRVVKYAATALVDCSLLPNERLAQLREEVSPEMPTSSRIFINATMQWAYPPVSLPKEEFMQKDLELWQKEGLPTLKLKEPWWGRDLGYWSETDETNARRAVCGEYYQTGKIQAQMRRPTSGELRE